MGQQADEFLSSFNRIEKYLRNELGNPTSMGFSEMVRRLSRRRNLQINKFEDDLLQLAQLRNAIIHEQIGEDFIIAEPNEWAVNRIKEVEQELAEPEKVLPQFGKKVTGFEKTLPLNEMMKIVVQKHYSQFPLYDKGQFAGLLTLAVIGYWFAQASLSGDVSLEGKKAADLLLPESKMMNYKFVPGDTPIFKVEELFRNNGLLEAVLITKDGDPNGNLLGIIRPRDIFNQKEDA